MKSRHGAGFTLVEVIMVIVITGIIASFVGVFIKGAIDAYVDSARRAELSDVADTAVRRISRDEPIDDLIDGEAPTGPGPNA